MKKIITFLLSITISCLSTEATDGKGSFPVELSDGIRSFNNKFKAGIPLGAKLKILFLRKNINPPLKLNTISELGYATRLEMSVPLIDGMAFINEMITRLENISWRPIATGNRQQWMARMPQLAICITDEENICYLNWLFDLPYDSIRIGENWYIIDRSIVDAIKNYYIYTSTNFLIESIRTTP
jgi:hypothetical protein